MARFAVEHKKTGEIVHIITDAGEAKQKAKDLNRHRSGKPFKVRRLVNKNPKPITIKFQVPTMADAKKVLKKLGLKKK